jgi:hypothetical protein
LAKSRKNKVRKITASDQRAQLAIKRRNPAFRKHENRSKAEVTLAVDYLTVLVDGEDPRPLLEKSEELIEGMGGLQGVHEFLFMLDGLNEDWEDRLDEEGILTLRAISPQGIDFALQNEEDKARAIG